MIDVTYTIPTEAQSWERAETVYKGGKRWTRKKTATRNWESAVAAAAHEAFPPGVLDEPLRVVVRVRGAGNLVLLPIAATGALL